MKWFTVDRPGYTGAGWKKKGNRLDRLFGKGQWRIQYQWQDGVIDRDAALQLYEEAYLRHLQSNPDLLDWICSTASDVYDIEPENVESGLDYHTQNSKAIHLQDIAVRRCLQRLGRAFAGDHLVQIRGHESEGYCLNPGQVPFHAPEHVVKPSLSRGKWWDENSIEDFWQSNEVLQIAETVAEDVRKDYVLKHLEKAAPGKSSKIAVFGGSFNPIHDGHLRIAQELVDIYGFAKVIFVPNGDNYRKKGLISEEHRARMVQEAIGGEPRFELCEFELRREEVAHTIDTIQFLRDQLERERAETEFYLIRGSDVIRRMLRWKSLPALLGNRIIIPIRPASDPWESFGSDKAFCLHHDRFRLMRREYEDGLSSSIVRDRLRAGLSVRYLIPERVADYIHRNGLFT